MVFNGQVFHPLRKQVEKNHVAWNFKPASVYPASNKSFLSIFLQSGQPLLNCVLKNFATETDSAYFALHDLTAMYNAESDKTNKKFVPC